MPFAVINVESGDTLNSVLTHTPLTFATAEEANVVARELAISSGNKYRIKRVLDDSWKHREQQRFADGDYEYLPWTGLDWWDDRAAVAIHKEHYPHPSTQEPGKIAYTESPEKGMDDVQTQIKPSKYLEKFRDILENYGGSKYAMILAREFASIYEPRELRFAKTEDEIQAVYENCNSDAESCMGSEEYRKDHGWGYPEAGKWPGDVHACRVYAGELQIAYITEDSEDEDSEVVARAVIWPEKKTHSRIYGAAEATLKRALQQAGYTFNPPIGAKLQRVPHGKRFLLPYIDGGSRSGQGSLAVLDKSDHLEICWNGTAHSYKAGETSGLSSTKCNANGNETQLYLCLHCGEEGTGGPIRIHNSEGARTTRCEHCVPNDAWESGADGHWYFASVPHVDMWNGTWWTQRQFNASGFTCQGTGLRYPRNDCVRLEDGTLWCTAHYRRHGFCSDWTGKRYRREEAFITTNGEKVAQAEFLVHGFECRSCTGKFAASRKSRRANAGSICVRCDEAEQAIQTAELPEAAEILAENQRNVA